MLSFPGFEELVSKQDLDVFDNGRYEEIVQMLSDLGYLVISPEEDKIVDADVLKEAVYTFRRETIKSLLNSRNSLQLPFPEIPREDHEGILTYREYSLLQLLVSFDGDFILKPVAEVKDYEIYTRVLQYRMHLLGLLPEHPDGHFSEGLSLALEKLSAWLSPVEPAELLELTGDIRKLISGLYRKKAFTKKIVYFNYKYQGCKSFSISGNNIEFVEQLKHNVDHKSAEFCDLMEHVKNFDSDFFKDRCSDEEGNFLIRLLQLYQWTSGYYLGVIDGSLGKLTFDSFLELARSEVEKGNSDFKTNLLVGYIDNDYWVVNPHYLLGEFSYRPENFEPNIDDVFNLFENEYDKLSSKEKQHVDANMSFAWEKVNVGFSSDLKSSQNRFRRIYFGAKSLLKSFWTGIKNIFNSIKTRIIKVVSDLLNLVKNFVKYMYREIREALQLFSRGLKFLFFRKAVGAKDCFTGFDFDMDSLTVYAGQLTDEVVKRHRQDLLLATTGLTFCLTFTGKLVNLILITTLNWPKFILEAGIMLKKLVKECFATKDFPDFIVTPQ